MRGQKALRRLLADALPHRLADLRGAAQVDAAPDAGDLPSATALAQAAVAAAERNARDPARSADAGEALLMLARLQRDAGAVADSRNSARRAAERLAQGLGEDC